MAPMMKRNASGDYTCEEYPAFTPNVSPPEMFRKGSFGGGYFRDISIAGKQYRDAWREFEPHGWWDGLDVRTMVASPNYAVRRNRYRVKCGQSLEEWVDKGWIKTEFDSHGWVHWYCRFFLGRRCPDDERQISRWSACAGAKGRWKRNLIAKCVKARKSFDDETVSPTVRQLLLHWGYELTKAHHDEYERLLKRGQKTSFVPQHEMRHISKSEASGAGEHSSGEDDNEAAAEAKRQSQKDARGERHRKRARKS